METKKEIRYIIMILNMIARKYDIGIRDVYKYLDTYKGVAFLHEFYDVEHTLNTDDVIDDVLAVCSQNGGHLR